MTTGVDSLIKQWKEETNKGALLKKKGDLSLEEIQKPSTPGPNQALIAMKAVGICGSDVHYWTHGAIGDFVVREPMVLGHESAGIVVAVGPDVKHIKPGDKVALEPGKGCGNCEYCKGGRYNLCLDMKFFATPPIHGSLANFVLHWADLCFKLPENVTLEEGAMCEPLSVGVYACQRAGIKPGDSVAILGCGPIGLVTFSVAKALGANKIVMTDISDDRIKKAKEFGAIAISARGKDDEALSKEIKDIIGGPVNASIECCGVESATRTAIRSTASGGTVCCVGLNHQEMKLPIMDAGVREVDIKGIFRYRNTYPICLSLISTGAVDVKRFITHRFALKQVVEAFEKAKSDPTAIKIMFNL